jgi:hypothetical protein
MQVADVEMVRSVRRELARHHLDTSETQVGATHGVVHLYGRVRPVRGHENEFEEEIHTLFKALKQRPGVRDVVFEWTILGHDQGISKRLGTTAR